MRRRSEDVAPRWRAGTSLDDFGNGYSSFSHLRNYQVDRLKIDRSFIAGSTNSLEGGAIIRAIVVLARSSGLKVTAEGVETTEQSEFLSTSAATSCRDS